VTESIVVKVPELGDFKDVEVIDVLVKAGDVVELETPLITLETDKAAVEIASPENGVLRHARKVGDRVLEVHDSKLRGEQISLVIGNSAPHQFSGRVTGDAMEGTVRSGGAEARWNATRR